MADQAEASAGTLDTPKDAGKGPQGVYSRWMMEIDLASKTEEYWRNQAQDVNARYRDEKADTSKGNTYTVDGNRFSNSNRFNILYSNIQTICPALYNQSPKPDVRRRYRDADPLGKIVADIMERALSFTMDEYDFDRFMRLAIKDQQLTGRGVTRVKYDSDFKKAEDEDGEEYDEKAGEEVYWEHVNWADFRHGPGRTWEEVTWIAFRHTMTKAEGEEKFPETFGDVEMDYTPAGMEEKDGDPIADTFKRAVVWEIWDREKREVIFVAPSLKERPLKVEDDPLGLAHFFPIPRPLCATENTDSLVPVEPFRFYRDQADELDEMTKRISGIVRACKVRGIYDSTISEMSNLMDAGENFLIPAADVLPLMQAGGLDKAVWIWPIDQMASVLAYLYQQREAIKTTIYEITGIADIMRGTSAAQETLGAQQLKAQFGTMRLDDMRRDVQRYARDLVRMSAEIIAENFSHDTMQIMTEVELPTEEQKQAAVMQVQMMQAQGQPIPAKFEEGMALPTWEQAMEILRDDKQRAYRIDIETDATIAGDQASEQKAITELLTGISSFIQNAGPAVAAGYLPLEAAKALLMTSVRKFKMGREVEDALDMIGEGEDEEGGQDQAMAAQQQAMQEAQAQEQAKVQAEQQMAAQKAQVEQSRLEMDGMKAMKDAEQRDRELALKEREQELKEFIAQQPAPDMQAQWEYDLQVARERMEFEAMEADKQRQVELAKAIIAKSDGEGVDMDGAMDEAAMMMERITAALTAPRAVIRDEFGNIVGSETVVQ